MTHPHDAATPQQAATLQALEAGRLAAWVVVYPDGQWCVMRDGDRAEQHARDSHGIRLRMSPCSSTPA